MKKLAPLALLAGLVPFPAMAQQDVQFRAVPTSCGTVCGAATGTVLRTAPGAAYAINFVNGATAGFAVLYDAAAIPADGAIDPRLIRWCMPVAANTGIYTPLQAPMQVYYGLTFFVSSNSCTTKAAVTYANVTVQARL